MASGASLSPSETPRPANRPAAALLADGRLHLQHGPIDLIIGADGERDEVKRAYRQAVARFDGLLQQLVDELPLLRTAVSTAPPAVTGPVACRMAAAVWPHRGAFITPMAAVAGSVADEVLAAMVLQRSLDRASVNNGGDIALHLAPGFSYRVGVADVDAPVQAAAAAASRSSTDAAGHLPAWAVVHAAHPARGIATSGWKGRSFSLGIADSVTVLARSGAEADAAATVVANAVNVVHPGIVRVPAVKIQPDSDLGELPVTRGVPKLSGELRAQALDAGVLVANGLIERGLMFGALIRVQGESRMVGGMVRVGTEG